MSKISESACGGEALLYLSPNVPKSPLVRDDQGAVRGNGVEVGEDLLVVHKKLLVVRRKLNGVGVDLGFKSAQLTEDRLDPGGG